jgi:hypothetical protein
MLSDSGLFQNGDVVVHPRRREWGDGVVEQTTTIQHDGRTAQRLVVRFAHHGRVQINTAVAKLEPKGVKVVKGPAGPKPFNTRPALDLHENRAHAATPVPTAMPTGTPDPNDDSGWLATLESRSPAELLAKLPSQLTDPFGSPAERLKAALDVYRFSTSARSLIDWAIAQTGLHDPLSRYSRHELEQAFPRFARNRDDHLWELARELKHAGRSDLLREAARTVRHPQARSILQKMS